MPYPPPGHPHYMSDEDRTALENSAAATARARYQIDEEPIPMTTGAAALKYAELRKKIADAKKIMKDTAAGLFTEMSQELFSENPELMSFSWTQYTPYWCDGDVCEFSCHGDYPKVSMIVGGDLMGYESDNEELTINGVEVEAADELVRKFKDMGIDSFSKNGKTYTYDKKTSTVTKDGERVKTYDEYHKMFSGLERKVGAFMRNFQDEDMETMFGDHVQVTVKRDGTVETEKYEHD